MKKKHAMFYNSGGRRDHARIMMTASTLCVDSVKEAEAIDAYFPDVRAYIYSLDAPPYPFPVDTALAERGRAPFEKTCARCHGTYGQGGPGGPGTSYPNLVIGVEDVATDPLIVAGNAQFAGPFVKWFNESFYGQKGHLAPAAGYVAPPLDGIWATAPYLHNGSVPTLQALLDSPSRPKFWSRSFDSTDYDQTAVGWRYTVRDHGQAEEPSDTVSKTIYDTRLPGYSNSGHTYGDSLSAEDRRAVLEYLKTL
jgi:mono/diheme cytochrome c family protein